MSLTKKVMLTNGTQEKYESVQLTEEDIAILSEYSWDMTGYTSRFGYFYLGSEKENVKGLTKWQAENIYQLTPTPPGMEDALQDMEKSKRIDKEKKKEILKRNEAVADAYLVRAVREKNLLYLSFYLHGYEHRLNAKVYSFLRRNGMDTYDPALFLDMKLALQELLLKKLPSFDPSRDAKFLTYLHQFIYDAFKAFRMQQECWNIDSLDIYKGIRRMAAIHNANNQDKQKSVELFCHETGCKPKKAMEYLEQAIGIRARQTEIMIDQDEDEEAIIEDVTPDGVGDLCYVLWNQWMAEAVRNAMEKLPWRDQTILKARYAICDNCGGVRPMKEQYSYREIANLIGAGTDKGAEKACNTALKKLTAQLAQDNAIRVVDFELISTEKSQKKIAAAIYRYLADCDGEWGEIKFDFSKNQATILQLADWDTSKSHLYAQRVIQQILPTNGKHLPKKQRIVFER